MYIVLEGVVGTGKTTQAKKLHEYFQRLYPQKEIVLVREPGGTEIAETIRNVVQAKLFNEEMHPLTDAYLYASSRAQSLNSLVKPTLDNGGIVIADRSFCSSLAYQGRAQWLGMERVWEINQHAVHDVMPDMVLFMDFDIETGLKRTFDAKGDKRERQNLWFFEKVYEGYNKLFEFPPTAHLMHRVDASGSIEEVFERVSNAIASHFGIDMQDEWGESIMLWASLFDRMKVVS